MAHLNKWIRLSALALIPALFAGCNVTVEDGGYKPAIVDELVETTAPEETTSQEMELISLDGAVGKIVNGPADVYDKPDGEVVTTLKDGDPVIAIERSTKWVHIQQGWILAEYFELTLSEDEKEFAGFVNAGEVNVRSGPGTDNGLVGKVKRNELLLITETQEDDDKLKWGKFDKGWICLDYVSTDLFGVDAMILQDKTTVMGLAGEGGTVTELSYGQWVTIRGVEVKEGVIWGKVQDGWVDLSKTALNSFDNSKLHGTWRSYSSYNAWTFHTDGTFVFSEEDYEFSGGTLNKKGSFTTHEGSYIFDGKELHLYYITLDGTKTESSVRNVSVDAYMNGSDWIFKNDTANPLIKDLTPEKIYEEKFAPKSDPAAVSAIAGYWLYFTQHSVAEDGSHTAKGNVLTFNSDGTFSLQSFTFTATVGENEVLTWTATGGSSNSGTFVYDGTDMTLTGSSTATVYMPQGGTQISASGLDKLGGHDGVQPQTLYKVTGTDSATLCNIAQIIFGG